MARTRSKTLTDGEVRIMDALWALEVASVRQVTERIRIEEQADPAYNTVQTMMRILEEKGYVKHRKEGRAFIYEACVSRATARSAALQHVLGRFFGGSPQALMQNLLDQDGVDAVELVELKALLRDAEASNGESR